RRRTRAAAGMNAPLQAAEFANCIGGEWIKSRTGRTFDDVNPADTRDVVGRFQASSADDARAAVAAAAAAFDGWRRTPITKRAKVLLSAADYLEAHAAPFAEELTREEGKSVALAKDEVLRSAQTLRFYAIEGQSFSGETYPNDDPEMLVYSAREPLGVVSVITPWNFPISIPARKIAPALVTGNAVVFKPSSDAPLIGYRLAEALMQAGLPKGALNFVTGAAGEVGPVITESPAVRAISFTGSTAAGEQIHRAAHHPHADGARRQEPAHRHGGRRPRQGGGPRHQGRALAHWPGVHGHQPAAGAFRRQSGVHRQAGFQDQAAQGRQRHGPEKRDRATRDQETAGNRAPVRRHRQERSEAPPRRRALEGRSL